MDQTQFAIARVLTASALLAAGAIAALFLPMPLATALALLGLLRICWLEDNIKNDLDGRDQLPPNHLAPLEHRQWLGWHLLGLWPNGAARSQPPDILASAMRGQIQAWSALLLAALAIVLAKEIVLPPVLAIGLTALVLRLAFRRADALILTLTYLDRGRPLPRDLLIPHHSWAYSARAPTDDR